MKKITTILVIALLVLAIPSFVLAQGNSRSQGEPQQAVSGNRGIETAVQNLNRIVERNNNPEVGEQVRAMAQSHVQVQARTETALHQMSQRNEAVKFMIGPDYKNAGQVRSDVVGLRNDIRQLEQIKTEASSADAGDVQGAIDELQVEADELETQLAEQLTGFSLFGWLAKLLAR